MNHRISPLALAPLLVFLLSQMDGFAGEINCASVIQSKLEESSPRDRYKHAYCHVQAGNPETAERLFEGLEKELPQIDEYVHFYSGVAAMKREDWASAASRFTMALASQPSEGLRKRAQSYLAESYYMMGDYAKALEWFRAVYEADSRDWVRANALLRIGDAQSALGNYREAVLAYRQLWLDHPDSELAELAYARASELSKTQKVPFKVAKTDYKTRGDNLFAKRLWQRAYDNYKKAPISNDTRLHMGICKYHMGEYRDAATLLSGIESPEAMWWMASTRLKLGDEEEAVYILSTIHTYFPRSDRAQEGLYRAARIKHTGGDYQTARELYSKLIELYPDSKDSQDARWQLGWINYREGRYEEALGIFSALPSEEAIYWRARTLEKLGRSSEAQDIYRVLAASTQPSYYSYLAQEKTGVKPPLPPARLNPGSVKLAENTHPRKKNALFFIELGIYGDARSELDDIQLASLNPDEVVETSLLYEMAGNSYYSIKVASRLVSSNSLELAYPRGASDAVEYFAREYGVDDELIYSIIREESRFQEEVVSPSGAIGLMQIMPGTGSKTAEEVGLVGFSTSLLYTPETNIKIGTAYLKKLLDSFGGQTIYAIAGYNGGPHNVVKWQERLGSLDADEFVEEIPFKETRNYVKKVLRSYAVYRAIYKRSQAG
jgi:soluble lytic murein transglycosylase